MTRAVLIATAILSLAACATPPQASPPDMPRTVSTAALLPAPEPDAEPADAAKPLPVPMLEPASKKPERVSAPPQSLAEVNKAARQRAANATYEDAALVYTYAPGALYELQTAPSYISTILLEPGETVLDIAAGDTTRWMVSQTLTGSGETGRTLIIVKPLAAKLKTNIVLATDRRAYLIEAVSVAGDTYTAQVAWSYPKPLAAEPPPPPVLNYGYDITPPRRSAPVWTPVSVWDDGRKTWIAFSSNVAAADMPPLFVRTGEGLELVNYRAEGQTYVVDRIFDRAELRLGQKKSIVVRIDRREAARP